MKKEKKLFGNASAKLGFTRRLTDAFLTSRFIPLIVFFESFQKTYLTFWLSSVTWEDDVLTLSIVSLQYKQQTNSFPIIKSGL